MHGEREEKKKVIKRLKSWSDLKPEASFLIYPVFTAWPQKYYCLQKYSDVYFIFKLWKKTSNSNWKWIAVDESS